MNDLTGTIQRVAYAAQERPQNEKQRARPSVRSGQVAFRPGFRVAIGNTRSQAAVMVLPPGSREGSADNRHAGADQWLFVVDGTGVARVNGRKIVLKPGKLLLIEAGDRHELRNTGRSLLKTVSIYLPPAYRSDGSELPAGRSG